MIDEMEEEARAKSHRDFGSNLELSKMQLEASEQSYNMRSNSQFNRISLAAVFHAV